MTCKQRGDIPLRDQNPLPRNFFLWGPRNYLSTLQSATVLLNSDCKYKMDCVKTPLISMPWLLRDSCCYRVSTLSSSPIFVFFLTQHSLTRCRCRRSAEIANNAHKQVTPPPSPPYQDGSGEVPLLCRLPSSCLRWFPTTGCHLLSPNHSLRFAPTANAGPPSVPRQPTFSTTHSRAAASHNHPSKLDDLHALPPPTSYPNPRA